MWQRWSSRSSSAAAHDLVVQDLAPLLEALVRGDHGRGVLVAAVDELEEEDGAAAGDREVADFVHGPGARGG